MAGIAALAPAIPGILGGLAGLFGGGHGPSEQDKVLQMYEKILQESLNLYNSTDYRKIDDEALAKYQDSVMKQSMAMLGNYDATASAAGSPYGKSDTLKDRSRTQIAEDLAQQIGGQQLGLYTSEPARKAALLPGTGGIGGLAQGVDQMNAMNQQGIMKSIMSISGAIPWSTIFSGGHTSNNSQGGGLTGGTNDLPGTG